MRLFDWRWWLGLKPKFALQRPKNYSISVIIPAYNEEESIADTIDSIRSQTVKIEKVIVVDDFSTDKTGQVAREKGAIVLRTPENQGTKAMAQNFAIPMIETELVVTIDADTLLAPDAIEKTLPYFNNPKTASVCGFVVPQKIKTIWERGRFIEYIFGISLFKAAQNNVGAVLVSSGCFSTFKVDLLRKFGGFQARTMAEDMDLTWEFGINGYAIYCAQDALCFPIDPSTASVFIKQVSRWTRSFLQNIRVHNFRKNKKLGFFVYGYLLETLLSPLIMVALLSLYTGNLLFALLLYVPVEFMLILLFCSVPAIRIKKFWKMLFSIPSYFIIRPVNFCVFWYSIWKEWIVKERLVSWDKGH